MPVVDWTYSFVVWYCFMSIPLTWCRFTDVVPTTREVLTFSECCFTSTETVGLLGMRVQDCHLDFHTVPELRGANHSLITFYTNIYIPGILASLCAAVRVSVCPFVRSLYKHPLNLSIFCNQTCYVGASPWGGVSSAMNGLLSSNQGHRANTVFF